VDLQQYFTGGTCPRGQFCVHFCGTGEQARLTRMAFSFTDARNPRSRSHICRMWHEVPRLAGYLQSRCGGSGPATGCVAASITRTRFLFVSLFARVRRRSDSPSAPGATTALVVAPRGRFHRCCCSAIPAAPWPARNIVLATPCGRQVSVVLWQTLGIPTWAMGAGGWAHHCPWTAAALDLHSPLPVLWPCCCVLLKSPAGFCGDARC